MVQVYLQSFDHVGAQCNIPGGNKNCAIWSPLHRFRRKHISKHTKLFEDRVSTCCAYQVRFNHAGKSISHLAFQLGGRMARNMYSMPLFVGSNLKPERRGYQNLQHGFNTRPETTLKQSADGSQNKTKCQSCKRWRNQDCTASSSGTFFWKTHVHETSKNLNFELEYFHAKNIFKFCFHLLRTPGWAKSKLKMLRLQTPINP